MPNLSTSELLQVQHQILKLIQIFVSSVPQAILPSMQTVILLIKAKMEETYPAILNSVEESLLNHMLLKSYISVSLKSQTKDSSQQEATQFKNSLEPDETPVQFNLQPAQKFALLDTEVKKKEERQIQIVQSQPRNQPNRKEDSQPLNLGTQANQGSDPATVTQRKRRILKKRRVKASQKALKTKNVEEKKWPMLYITKNNLAEAVRETKQQQALNDRFERRLKRFINKEIRDYKEKLIHDQQVEKGKRSQPKIDSYFIRRQEAFNIFFEPIVNIDLQNWPNRDYRSIKIGSIKFTYFINNLLNVQVTDFTFEDKTDQLRKTQFLALKKHKFMSIVTGLLPKKRKLHYDKLFAIHRLIA